MNQTPAVSADTTRRRWWSEAAATGGTSALLDCSFDAEAGLDLTTAHPSGLAQLLAGGPTPLSSLVRESGAFAQARRRARAVHRRADALLAERGVRSLAVAVGTVGWVMPSSAGESAGESGGDPPARLLPRRTPVLLRRCTLTPTNAALDDFVVRLAPEVIVNPVLVRVGGEELGVRLDAERIGAAVDGHRGFDPAPALEEVRRQLTGTAGLRVERRLLLATFADPGADLLADLRRRGADMREHRVVRALAAGTPLTAPEGRTAAQTRDGEGPRPGAGGFSLDPAQRAAVEHVAAGGDLRVIAPTGTGATQVAAAVLAQAVASGQRVLLVADSAAERRTVDERLRDNGFGRLMLHLVGDLDASAVREDAAAQVATARSEVDARRVAGPQEGARPDLTVSAAPLEEHARALHDARAPWGVSAHDAMQALTKLAERPTAPSTTRRLRGQQLNDCAREDLPGWAARLDEAARLGAFDVSPASTPWADAQLRTDEAAAETLARVRRVVDVELPRVRALMATSCDAAGVRGASSVAEAHTRVLLMQGVRETVSHFGTEVFGQSLGDVAAGTATPQWRREHGVRFGALARWRLRRQARALLRPGVTATDSEQLHDWLQRARAQRLSWQRVAVRDGAPSVVPGLEELDSAVDMLRADLAGLDAVLPTALVREVSDDASLLGIQLPELAALLRSLALDPEALTSLPRRTVLLDELEAGGWGPLLADLGARWSGPGSVDLRAEVEAAWWSGVLDAYSMLDPLVGAPDASALRTARNGFTLAEAAARAHAARGVRAALDERAIATGLDLDLLPCLALSGVALAALAADVPDVDLVVVLGAQATATATLLPALSRADQVVLLGDPDLPGPRELATAGGSRGAALGEPSGRSPSPQVPGPQSGGPQRTSVLDDAGGVLPSLWLERQHACLDDRLVLGIGLPGRVQDSLPGVGMLAGARSVRRTSNRPVGERRGPEALVDLVVDIAVEVLRLNPEESLGMVVADPAGAELVADAVRRRVLQEQLPMLQQREPLLVADPSRWSGERRDHVLVVADAVLPGAGLGAEPSDEDRSTLAEVRLAMTRSRLRTTLVLDDSGWGGTDSPKVAAGRRVLDRAALTWEAPQPTTRDLAVSALVRRLAAACRAVGLPVSSGVGESRVLALVVRDDRSRVGVGPALAIELDDAAWAAVPVLEREVATPARVERRGWRYVRALEADVFADPAGEADRIATLWRDAVTEAGHDDPETSVVDLTEPRPVLVDLTAVVDGMVHDRGPGRRSESAS